MKGFGILYKKMRQYFQKKKYFSKILDQIFKKLGMCIKNPVPLSLLTVE